jgi:hypothetical protein
LAGAGAGAPVQHGQHAQHGQHGQQNQQGQQNAPQQASRLAPHRWTRRQVKVVMALARDRLTGVKGRQRAFGAALTQLADTIGVPADALRRRLILERVAARRREHEAFAADGLPDAAEYQQQEQADEAEDEELNALEALDME